MNKSNRHILYFFCSIIDMVLIVASFLFVSYLYVGTFSGIEHESEHIRWASYSIFAVIIYAFVVVCFYAFCKMFGYTYKGRFGRMATVVVLVDLIGMFIFASVLYFFRIATLSRVTLLLFYICSGGTVILFHCLVIAILGKARTSGRYVKPVLVIGAGPLAFEYIEQISRDTSRLEHVIGYVIAHTDSLPKSSSCASSAPASCMAQSELQTTAYTCYGTIDSLDDILKQDTVEEIVAALELDDYSELPHIMEAADKYGTKLRIMPFYNDLIPRNPSIETIGNLKLINVRTTALDNLALAAFKRGTDIVVSAIIIIIISWLLVILAIGVKVSSPGPVFFKQQRIGKYKKPFMMLKFRSMRLNDESTTAWSTNEDVRKTRFGSFIRKYSLDELPQFINVFKGDMSIVGPRPEIPHYVYQFREDVPLYMLRHQFRPGITGWAQVNGLRGDTSIQERVTYDLYYIEHWSPWFDIKIFFRTLFGGFKNDEQLV